MSVYFAPAPAHNPPMPQHAAPALIQGWLMMAGLIVAIGAQNAQVLRQGLLRSHVGAVVVFCTVSDWLLVAAGVFSFGALLASAPGWLQAMRWAGAAFVLWFAGQAARRAWRGSGGLTAGAAALPLGGRAQALSTTAALTWLNPHVYLDTVVLLGSVGAQQPPEARVAFAAGAGLASAMWFSLLGFGAAALGQRLARSGTWRAIDGIVALVMGFVGVQLLVRPL